MHDAFSSVQFWTYTLVVVSLSPLAAVLGTSWGWTAGAATLVVLAGPVCLAGLTTHIATARWIAGLACISCFLEPMIAQGTLHDMHFGYPTSAGCTLLAISLMSSSIAQQLRLRVDALQSQNTDIVRELYQTTHRTPPPESESAPNTALSSDSDTDSLDYPMLLLSIQDIVRRISTNLELESLYPTIINCAKSTLECRSVQIHLWSPDTRQLTNPLTLRPRDASQYCPQTTSGMAGWVITNRQMITRQTMEKDLTLAPILDQDLQPPDAIAPLNVGGELLGLLVVDQIREDSNTFARLLYILANVSALAIKNAQLFNRIELMARHDGLTGLLNHNTFHAELAQLTQRFGSAPLCIIMGDVDHFKAINDNFGHPAGDHVLRETARLWKAVLPSNAIIARYGGEEFICILPGHTQTQGEELADVLRQTLQDFPFDFEGREIAVTASFGVAERTDRDMSDALLIRRADQAMYQSKSKGRNRVDCYVTNATDSSSYRRLTQIENTVDAAPEQSEPS